MMFWLPLLRIWALGWVVTTELLFGELDGDQGTAEEDL